MRVLLIKMSSLGDVVHALAPVTDAARAKPGIIFDWVVEEAYQEIPKWHSAVRRVIVAPLRRWRNSPIKTIRSGEWAAFRAELRSEKYDFVLDAQGLLKSAFVGRQAPAPLVGRSFSTAREPAAALFYARQIPVDLRRTEVEQVRELFAKALDYPQPTGPADFGIDRTQFGNSVPERYALLLHGAAWESKLWPEDRWIAVGKRIKAAGLNLLLPWGSEGERQRAEKIAAAIGGTVLPKLGVAELARTIANAEFVIGLDTGLTHIGVALGVPTIAIYGPSAPVYESMARGELINLCSIHSKTVDTSRRTTVAADAVIGAVQPWL
ncbi:MAG: lipopolysaccharide heptosyltransferase I, partial [Limisphaerales bacterium]